MASVTYGEFDRAAAGDIHYGAVPVPFGELLIAAAPQGLCFAAFVDGATQEAERLRLLRRHAGAAVHEDAGRARDWAASLFGGGAVRLALAGTPFQLRVWRALLAVPPGRPVSYRDIAGAVGMPGAVRAVANAVAANPVHYAVPCHRVIRSDGSLGGFRAGADMKRRLLAAEGYLQ